MPRICWMPATRVVGRSRLPPLLRPPPAKIELGNTAPPVLHILPVSSWIRSIKYTFSALNLLWWMPRSVRMSALSAVANRRATQRMSSAFRSHRVAAFSGVTRSAKCRTSLHPWECSATNASSTSPSPTSTLTNANKK